MPAAAAAKSLQSCPTLCEPIDSSPDSPGKNTGVGCHFLLQCLKVKSESEVTQPCLTPSDPMDCSLPGSSVHGIFQARVLEWGAIAFSDRHAFMCLNLFNPFSITTGQHFLILVIINSAIPNILRHNPSQKPPDYILILD